MPSSTIAAFPAQAFTLAILLFGLAALCALLRGQKASNTLFSGVLLAGSLLILYSVGTFWPSQVLWHVRPIYLGLAPLSNQIDPLSSVFLVLLACVSIAAAIYSPSYLHHLQNRVNNGLYWACTFLFVIGMAEVLVSANALTFLVFWEFMSLSSVVLVASEPTRQRAQRAALIYLGATRISSAFIMGAFLWMHYLSGSWFFYAWNLDSFPIMPALLLFLGLCIKAGIWPFHIWLPYAHPEAPSPISALMSGVMVKVAIYAMIRFLFVQQSHSVLIAYLAVVLGLISSVWGILFALMEKDLKRLLAYSTVENVGLIVSALGLSMICQQKALYTIAGLAFMAALFHAVNHCFFKSLLFLGAGAVDSSAHTRDLNFLGALSKKMPWTMGCFFVGCLAVCCLPPLNGFASKWLVYQGFFQLSFKDGAIVDRALAFAVIGFLSVVGALSVACFSKALGICFLGKPRSDLAIHAKEAAPSMIAAQLLLVGACIGLALLVPHVLNLLIPVSDLAHCTAGNTTDMFPLPMGGLCLTGIATAGLAFFLLLGPATYGLRTYVTWDCGYGDLPSRAEETGSSFSLPIARIFSGLLQFRSFTEIRGKDRRHFPETIIVEAYMLPWLETKVYEPSLAFLQKLNQVFMRFQTASIHIHLLYLFTTLLVLVCLGMAV